MSSPWLKKILNFDFLKRSKMALFVVFQGLVYFTMVEEIFEFWPSEILQNGLILLIWVTTKRITKTFFELFRQNSLTFPGFPWSKKKKSLTFPGFPDLWQPCTYTHHTPSHTHHSLTTFAYSTTAHIPHTTHYTLHTHTHTHTHTRTHTQIHAHTHTRVKGGFQN